MTNLSRITFDTPDNFALKNGAVHYASFGNETHSA